MLQTKRFLYSLIIDEYSVGCHALLGARKIGKTILLLQLAQKEDTDYLDISTQKDDFSVKDFLELAKQRGIRRVCFDEVCKISEDNYADFISEVKLYSSELSIFITGSVSSVVKSMQREIGRGNEYRLPPIMYIERLCWDNNQNMITVDNINNLTSVDRFKEYLKNQNFQTTNMLNSYIYSVVKDTLDSYLNNSAIGDFEVPISDISITNALKYISLCQYVFKVARGEVCKLPSISKELKSSNTELLKAYRDRWGLSKDEILYTCSILYGCGLAKKIPLYKGNLISLEEIKSPDNILEAFMFEYPWLTTYFFSDRVQDSKELMNLWVESYISLKASYLYMFYDKLRNVASEEIDLIYSVEDSFYGLEVKNRVSSNLSRDYISETKSFAERVGLEKVDFTCTDDCFTMLRIDLVAAAMELEYINIVKLGEPYSKSSIGNLVKIYFTNGDI